MRGVVCIVTCTRLSLHCSSSASASKFTAASLGPPCDSTAFLFFLNFAFAKLSILVRSMQWFAPKCERTGSLSFMESCKRESVSLSWDLGGVATIGSLSARLSVKSATLGVSSWSWWPSLYFEFYNRDFPVLSRIHSGDTPKLLAGWRGGRRGANHESVQSWLTFKVCFKSDFDYDDIIVKIISSWLTLAMGNEKGIIDHWSIVCDRNRTRRARTWGCRRR